MTTLTAIEKRLAKIEAAMVQGEWLPEDQAIKSYQLSRKYLQNLRRQARVRYRSINGRKFRYYKPDLENLYQ